jgi:hypothetical protein
MKKEQFEEVRRLQKEAVKFAKTPGNNSALFWAGRLSMAAGAVVQSNTANLSSNIAWLDTIRQEYDADIFSRSK